MRIEQRYEEMARYFKALAHPVRITILAALRHGEQCVCHLEALLGRPQAYVSQQLAVLRDMGLVQDRKDGQRVYYRIADERVHGLLDQFLLSEEERAAGLVWSLPQRLDNCRCPQCEEAPVAV